MKHSRLIFLIILTFFCTDLIAQRFNFGPTVGVHAYKVAFHNEEEQNRFDSKYKLGYKVGAFMDFPLADNFSWAAEAYYSKKGRKISYGSATNNASYTFYEISALLRKAYNINVIDNVPGKFFFNVGPNINYWANGKGVLEDNVNLGYVVTFGEPDGEITNNAITDANRWLFGLELGVGMDVGLNKNQFFQLELRYTLGQTYLGSKDGSNIPILTFDDSLRSNYRVLTLMVRYGIEFDAKNNRKGKSTIKRKKK